VVASTSVDGVRVVIVQPCGDRYSDAVWSAERCSSVVGVLIHGGGGLSYLAQLDVDTA